ncbi:MAG: Uma2 family endonuclease [Aeromicrobium sp.]|uniref:Uma2 family endonuclease n=1 Tax=Aeromicrobium sp. TaxID=1871063 RepID=UPI0039E728D3
MTIAPISEAPRGDLIVYGGPFTVDDLDTLPDDGYRHELLDGVLVMSPAPNTRHQDIALSLGILLRAHAPADHKVMIAPFDVRLGPRISLEPDLIVARRADITAARLPTAPLLAVEIASPSTRLIDLGRKRELLAQAGCPSYWTIEPDGPELTVWALAGGVYVEEARVAADASWTATLPFPVTVTPAELLDD